ncbi:hypothetical protein NFI96_003561 [Prochilodus magdalenae]|nr:hypothetical protein NFI96_003561 [Prochilodus magdalenae]
MVKGKMRNSQLSNTVRSHCQSNQGFRYMLAVPEVDRILGTMLRRTDAVIPERDECAGGQSLCDESAICTNTIHGHLCTCKPGYVGNGTICRGPPQDHHRAGMMWVVDHSQHCSDTDVVVVC